MGFEMIFCENSSEALGILFRAENLENYFMLQISYYSQDRKLRVIPHVRLFGNWEVLGEQPLAASGGSLKLDSYFRVKLQVYRHVARLYISSVLVYEWVLPTHLEPMLRQHRDPPSSGDRGEQDKTRRGSVPEIPFRNKYGMVGFRAYPGEQAEIRGLEIKAI